MNGQDCPAEILDVFLCHNSEEKPAVREIAERLSQENIKPWLDEADIITGGYWHDAIGKQIETVKAAAVFFGSHGVGRWQSREIIALLNQSDRQGCPIIPVILASDTNPPVVPWSLEGLNWVDFRAASSQPLKRLILGITGQKPVELYDVPESEKPATMHEANKRLLVAGAETKKLRFDDRESSEARLYPPLVDSPNRDQAAQLEILRRRVKEYWVDGVLKHSLYNEVLISLGKREIGNAVDAPWKYTVEVSDATNSAPLDDRDVSAIYDATGLLLILGEPGSGKTTTLLDLARTLLERARQDIKERVPVVVNLSAWKKKQPLVEWIAVELSEKYRVPRKIARFWLENDYLLPLLDGLDEIETSMQPDCVAAINAFIEELKPSGLVACCRLNEYRWLPKRLKLNGAICIEPLSSEEVNKYLARGGSKLAALREAANTDSVFQELAQTPLMLSIMSLTYQGTDGNVLAVQKGGSVEERRKQIFCLYVDQMLRRKRGTSLAFPKEKIISWLSWLAGKMREHSQSVLLVEGLQPTWLGTKSRCAAYTTTANLCLWLVSGLISGLVGGLVTGLGGLRGFPALCGLLVPWLTAGLIVKCFDSARAHSGRRFPGDIILVERIRWNQLLKPTITGLLVGGVSGLLVGLLVGFFFGLLNGLLAGVLVGSFSVYLFWLSPFLGLRQGNGLASGFTDKEKLDKAFPNEGIKLSLQNSLVVFLVTSLVGGLIFGPPFGVIAALADFTGLQLGLFLALILALDRGGSAVIKHYALRLILWRSGYTPFKFVKFLDYCARLIFLKKVGGGYIFIHRMLLEYFADLPTIEKSGNPERGS